MPLPEIIIPTPVAVPAQAATEYDKGYILRLKLGTFPDVGETKITDGANQTLTVALRPYNATATPKVYDGEDHDVVHTIDNLWAEVYRVPLLAQVMGGIVTAVNLLVQERALIAQIEAATEEDQPALQAQLVAVHTQLGL